MLGSVFNRYQASSSSEPSKAQQTKLRILKFGKDTYPFSEFRGLGPPGLDIGLPGDIYIDLTPGLHALHARYPERWTLWPGSKDLSTLLLHPTLSDRCLWCNDTIGWFHRRSIRVNPSGTASEVLSETLKYQATLSEGSKKRKRDAVGQVHQPMQTKPSSMTNTSSPSQNHTATSLESQSPIDAPSFLHSTTSTVPYSQPAPALEIMIPGTLIPASAPIIQNSGCCPGSPPTDSCQSSIPTETDGTITSKDLEECSDTNPQERYTSPKRIDLRKIAFGGAKPRPSPKLQKQRASSPTRSVDTRSLSHPTNEDQPRLRSPSLPCVISQPSIQDSETSMDLRKDDASPNQSINSIAIPDQPISFNLSEANRAILNVAIAEFRKMKDISDANAAYVQAADDKIRHLEAENAELRAQLLSQCQCNLSSSSRDIPPMVTNVEMLPATGSRLYHPCEEELESSSAPRRSATPSISLLLANASASTETPATGNLTAIFKAEANTPPPEGCKSFESNVSTCPSVKEEIVDVKLLRHVSLVPLPALLQMREIHRSVLFAKAGSFLICRLCLGATLGGIETVDQVFKTAEGSLELMQEHCEKEHSSDCEALMNMKDQELLDLVSMISV